MNEASVTQTLKIEMGVHHWTFCLHTIFLLIKMFDRNVKIVACSSSRYNGDASA